MSCRWRAGARRSIAGWPTRCAIARPPPARAPREKPVGNSRVRDCVRQIEREEREASDCRVSRFMTRPSRFTPRPMTSERLSSFYSLSVCFEFSREMERKCCFFFTKREDDAAPLQFSRLRRPFTFADESGHFSIERVAIRRHNSRETFNKFRQPIHHCRRFAKVQTASFISCLITAFYSEAKNAPNSLLLTRVRHALALFFLALRRRVIFARVRIPGAVLSLQLVGCTAIVGH